MLWLPDDGSQLGLYVPLGLLETGVGVGLKIVFWIGDIPEEKKYELLFEIYISLARTKSHFSAYFVYIMVQYKLGCWIFKV